MRSSAKRRICSRSSSCSSVREKSTPEALAWSEQCRSLYSDFGVDYAEYAMGTLADRCFTIPLR